MEQSFLERVRFKVSEIKSDKRKRSIAILTGILALLVGGYLSGYLAAFLTRGVGGIGLGILEYYRLAFFTWGGLRTTLLLAVLIAAIGGVLLKSGNNLNHIKTTDDRGVNYSDVGTYGTAEFMSEAEARTVFEVTDIQKAQGVILGQFTTGGKEVICLPKDTQRNRNILILGSPGTGKSFCYARNAIFQAIVRGESIVLTDPKGELYESTASLLKANGYRVLVYNLNDPLRSDSWDCVSEIYDPETLDVNQTRVAEFADTVMKNTCEDKDDHFWGMGEQNLFKAAICYCGYVREQDLKALYQAEVAKMEGSLRAQLPSQDMEQILRTLSDPESSMRDRETVVRFCTKLLYGEEEAEQTISRLHKAAHTCNMSDIYYMLVTNDLKALEEKFADVPISHPAGIAWSIFKGGSENTRPGFVQGLSQRLQLFQMRDVRRITTNEGINLADISARKTALFCVISDKSTAMRPISSLFFNFLFRDISDAADRYGSKNRLPVNVICDEFANLGKIPSFEVVISTVRSRKINISIILQSVTQLSKVYEEDNANTIIACCDTILFLGCNDGETASFIADLAGIADVRVISSKDSKNTSLGNRGIMQGYQVSEGDGKRNVLNPDEVRRLGREEVIIYHNGCHILRAKRCGYIEHPYYKAGLISEKRLRDYPLASVKYAANEDLDAFVQGDILTMTRKNVAVLQGQAIAKYGETTRAAIQDPEKKAESKPTLIRGEGKAFDF